MNLCECGCGTEVKYRFVKGHANRGKTISEWHKQRIREGIRNRKPRTKHIRSITNKIEKLQITTEGVMKDFFKVHAEAMELFKKPHCFICDKKLTELEEKGDKFSELRMFNIDGEEMEAKNWICVCRYCYIKLTLKRDYDMG